MTSRAHYEETGDFRVTWPEARELFETFRQATGREPRAGDTMPTLARCAHCGLLLIEEWTEGHH